MKEDDFQYAIENTQVILAPEQKIATFGTTSFRFYLISELMDRVNEVRVRDGKFTQIVRKFSRQNISAACYSTVLARKRNVMSINSASGFKTWLCCATVFNSERPTLLNNCFETQSNP